MNLDMEAIRRKLIAKRVIVGPKTRKGRICSNLVDQLKHFQTATGDRFWPITILKEKPPAGVCWRLSLGIVSNRSNPSDHHHLTRQARASAILIFDHFLRFAQSSAALSP